MYKINTEEVDGLGLGASQPLDYLMLAKKINRPSLIRQKRAEKLLADPFCILHNSRGLRPIDVHNAPNATLAITGAMIDVVAIIKQNLPSARFVSRFQGARHDSKGRPIVKNKKDTWYLNASSNAEDADNRSIPPKVLALIERRPITFELMPVCGHFMWGRDMWFILRTQNMQNVVNALSDNIYNDYSYEPKTFIAINSDNLEVRRMMFRFLPLKRYVKQTIDYGTRDPHEVMAAKVTGHFHFKSIGELHLYTKEYKQRFGIDDPDQAGSTIWPMWLARELLVQDPTRIHELGWILFEHCMTQTDWLDRTGLWHLMAARRAAYIKKRGEDAWDNKHKHFHPILNEEADRARIQRTQETFGGCIPETGWEPDEGDHGSGDEHGGCESDQGVGHADLQFVNS